MKPGKKSWMTTWKANAFQAGIWLIITLINTSVLLVKLQDPNATGIGWNIALIAVNLCVVFTHIIITILRYRDEKRAQSNLPSTPPPRPVVPPALPKKEYCPTCGAELPPDALFCIGCGKKVAHTGPTRHLK